MHVVLIEVHVEVHMCMFAGCPCRSCVVLNCTYMGICYDEYSLFMMLMYSQAVSNLICS